MTATSMGEMIYGWRINADLTQDEFGSRHNISGPAVFKFEKGYVRPSLALWQSMAGDNDITEERAVLMWAREKVPPEYRHLIDVQIAPFLNGKKKKAGAEPAYIQRWRKTDEFHQLMPSSGEVATIRNVFDKIGPGETPDLTNLLLTIRRLTAYKKPARKR